MFLVHLFACIKKILEKQIIIKCLGITKEKQECKYASINQPQTGKQKADRAGSCHWWCLAKEPAPCARETKAMIQNPPHA